MSVAYKELNDTVRAWVVDLLQIDGRTVQPVRQNQAKLPPKINGQLLTVNILNQNPIGWDTPSYKNQAIEVGSDLDETVYGDRNVTCQITAYGEDSINLVEKLTLKTLSAKSIEYLNSNNLGYINRSDVLSIPAIEQANFEERHQVDYNFHYTISDAEVVNAVGSANVGGLHVWGTDIDTESFEVDINIENN